MSANVIGANSRVTLAYTLRLEDGFEADASSTAEPLEFQVGDGTLEPGLEQLLFGLKRGDRERFLIAPEQVFGLRDAENIHRMPREQFGDMPLEEGLVISFDTPGIEGIPGTVVAVDGDMVEVDFNHPLAGHTLDFEVEVLAVENHA